ncbi:hypothetical protein SKAU_G00302080 [Synaphobranchus kaupii]|uniref:Uncharacterized protein n=1 Tax=Synaphobranchus kaupii TaxID=118154 RepID=A0A9Q1IL98_SYNKA|nr:hypothetical protein SKAU_G00302080 [Synaphobranchus kaupii]
MHRHCQSRSGPPTPPSPTRARKGEDVTVTPRRRRGGLLETLQHPSRQIAAANGRLCRPTVRALAHSVRVTMCCAQVPVFEAHALRSCDLRPSEVVSVTRSGCESAVRAPTPKCGPTGEAPERTHPGDRDTTRLAGRLLELRCLAPLQECSRPQQASRAVIPHELRSLDVGRRINRRRASRFRSALNIRGRLACQKSHYCDDYQFGETGSGRGDSKRGRTEPPPTVAGGFQVNEPRGKRWVTRSSVPAANHRAIPTARPKPAATEQWCRSHTHSDCRGGTRLAADHTPTVVPSRRGHRDDYTLFFTTGMQREKENAQRGIGHLWPGPPVGQRGRAAGSGRGGVESDSVCGTHGAVSAAASGRTQAPLCIGETEETPLWRQSAMPTASAHSPPVLNPAATQRQRQRRRHQLQSVTDGLRGRGGLPPEPARH